MARRARAGLGAALLGLALAASGCRRAPAVDLVVLITVDTLRADHLGAYGYPRPTSPFIDRLAREGAVFETALTACSFTAPAHATLFTSLQPVQHRVLDNAHPLDPSLVTLADVFAARGFATAAFVSTGFLRTLRGGFATFDHPRDVRDRVHFRRASATVDRAVEWLQTGDPSAPAFLWVHLFDVHESDAEALEDPDDWRRMRATPLGGESLDRFLVRRHGVPARYVDAEALAVVNRYDAQIVAVDRQIERLYRVSSRQPRHANSLWIVTADHGEGLWRHGYRGHGQQVYQEQLRVPLIFHFPDGRYPPRRIPDLVHLVDVLPTLAEVLGVGVRPPLPLQGRSLVPLLAGRRGLGPAPPAFSQRRAQEAGEADRHVYVLQDRRFKLIDRSEGGDELYDLREDPFEQTNLIESRAGDAERLRSALRARLDDLLAHALPEPPPAPVDPELLRELEALGYARPGDAPGPQVPPKR